MQFLVIYGTTEGQAKKISEFVSRQIETTGSKVDCVNSVNKLDGLRIAEFDAVIIVGSVHQKIHQESLSNFVIAHREQLKKIPTLMISVSLSVAFSNGQAEAKGYIDKFIEYTGFTPGTVSLVAGALRYSEYDYFMTQVVEHVVLATHENIQGDREFTDWKQLGKDVDTFVETVVEHA